MSFVGKFHRIFILSTQPNDRIKKCDIGEMVSGCGVLSGEGVF